jgi:hypothetical protein
MHLMSARPQIHGQPACRIGVVFDDEDAKGSCRTISRSSVIHCHDHAWNETAEVETKLRLSEIAIGS